MPSRKNIKTIVTPEEIQGSDAWVKIKNITIDEARALQSESIRIDKELEPERKKLFKAYAEKLEKLESDLTDNEKVIALGDSPIVKESEKFLYKYYSDYVVDWNWVLDDDTPMNKPHGNPDIFGILTAQEFGYIQSLFKQDESDQKK